MHHNSFHNREKLIAMNRNPLALERRNVHRNVKRRENAQAYNGQVVIDKAWSIATPATRAAELAGVDLRDFLSGMNVELAEISSNVIFLNVDDAEVGFRIRVTESRINLTAHDAAALWAGIVHLENEMCSNGAPILLAGEVHREPAWNIHISAPPWGANFFVPDLSPEYLSDDAFRLMAHHGVNGMLLYGDFLCYANGTRFPELELPDVEQYLDLLRDATERAINYGVRFYYCPVSPKLRGSHPLFQRLPAARGSKIGWRETSSENALYCLCSSDADALAFHAEAMGNLFIEVPELGGLILIVGGESYYHCFMRSGGVPKGETNCPVCSGKRAENVIAGFLKATSDAVHAAQPHAEVMAWPYSAAGVWSHSLSQWELIDSLPDDVALLSEIEKDETIQKDGYTKAIWDYSIDSVGPSDRIVAQAIRCGQRGRDLFIKTEEAQGLELVNLPYVPCLTRLARKWRNVRALRPRGVLQTWGFFGMFDAPTEQLAYEACWNPEFAVEGNVQAIASRLYGATGSKVVEAWRAFDRAVEHIPMLLTGNYYMGPLFLGPAHPLPVWEGGTPDAFRGSLYYLAESEETFSAAKVRSRDDLVVSSIAQLNLGDTPPTLAQVIEEFTTARDYARQGWQLLENTTAPELAEERALAEYLYRTFVTTVHLLQFLRAKELLPGTSPRALIAAEVENTAAAIAILQRAPWLNLALRNDVGAPDSIGMMQAKIAWLQPGGIGNEIAPN